MISCSFRLWVMTDYCLRCEIPHDLNENHDRKIWNSLFLALRRKIIHVPKWLWIETATISSAFLIRSNCCNAQREEETACAYDQMITENYVNPNCVLQFACSQMRNIFTLMSACAADEVATAAVATAGDYYYWIQIATSQCMIHHVIWNAHVPRRTHQETRKQNTREK